MKSSEALILDDALEELHNIVKEYVTKIIDEAIWIEQEKRRLQYGHGNSGPLLPTESGFDPTPAINPEPNPRASSATGCATPSVKPTANMQTKYVTVATVNAAIQIVSRGKEHRITKELADFIDSPEFT